MIHGVIAIGGQAATRHSESIAAACTGRGITEDAVRLAQPAHGVALAYYTHYKTSGYKELSPACTGQQDIAVVFTGQIYNQHELEGQLQGAAATANTTELVLQLYRKFGHDFVNRLNGKFAFAIWDRNLGQVTLGRDRLGIEPLYYYCDGETLVFASETGPITRFLNNSPDIHFPSLCKFLLFGYNPGLDTFYSGVRKVRPGYLVHCRDDGSVEPERYWKLSYSEVMQADEETVCEELREYLQRAVSIRMTGSEPYGVFVSGGMDSSSVLGLASRNREGRPYTFSYRCGGESFDESPYARCMAESVNSIHSEIEYRPDDVLSMRRIVEHMDEPFCDVGINIATFLLGNAAHEEAAYVLTGDGGDELFAGHPVYEADKIARFIDPIPGILKQPALYLAGLLPDSDKKKNLTVKLKRFSESISYPPELLSHRWRIYYRPADLEGLLTRDANAEIAGTDLYDDMTSRNREADGRDFLSNSLYSDYHTVMDFYLRRNDINRGVGLETRYPMLDHELVEYCARIPMDMKIRGWFDNKYIFRKSMEPVLPHRIVHREDKLGHSIPLKNWLRDDRKVREFVLDHLTESTLLKRGWLNPARVNDMVKRHMDKRCNNSHRLWTLAVLEMWLREHVDTGT
jgi:asparagine synthase (glutamine-hydrolysing)